MLPDLQCLGFNRRDESDGGELGELGEVFYIIKEEV